MMVFSLENIVFKDLKRTINFIRSTEIISVFVLFVIQPLFFLNGDVKFRKRVLNHGLFSALKQELFFIKVIWILFRHLIIFNASQ